ncbi:Aste57867_16236 [Aphanomyces stellatus]|uniref:Aste57867_16236 protein n=1 Tax=Aphanomyces stellatus TaxID=120398 RepID=A0A485L516_9STRA|nr:hypothetical protein As57867_016179 [Aphanomyces stellatus]VFT93014.1 Aste57867_16236 [Aphanomyces stellatus]
MLGLTTKGGDEPRVGDDDRPQRETNRRRACLEAKYVQHTGSKADTTEEAFVASSCSRWPSAWHSHGQNVQNTARGMHIEIEIEFDKSKIIVTAVADEGDLKTRSEYCLQASNKPFGDVHTAKLVELEATMTTAGLRTIISCGVAAVPTDVSV